MQPVDEGAEPKHDVTVSSFRSMVPLRSLVNVQSKTPYPNLELQTDRFHVVHSS